MRSRVRILLAVPLLLVAAACGGSDDAASDDAGRPVDTNQSAPVDSEPADSTDAGAADDGSVADGDAADDVVIPTLPAGLETGGDGTATLALENGESYEFDGVLCTLEPQMAAGSEILFTATSYGDPGLDVTQFGDEGPIAGIAAIEVYDASYETLWEAFSFGDATVELTLDGTTIRGTGQFFDDDEASMETVQGGVTVNC